MQRETKGELVELGEVEQLVLLAVWHLGGQPAYSVSICNEVRRRSGRRLSLSTIYLTTTRLEQKGLVWSRMTEPTARRGGKAKRSFRIVAEGKTALRVMRHRMNRMWDGLETVPARASLPAASAEDTRR